MTFFFFLAGSVVAAEAGASLHGVGAVGSVVVALGWVVVVVGWDEYVA